MDEVAIKKMIREINSGDYASAKEQLKSIVEAKIQQKIKDSMIED